MLLPFKVLVISNYIGRKLTHSCLKFVKNIFLPNSSNRELFTLFCTGFFDNKISDMYCTYLKF